MKGINPAITASMVASAAAMMTGNILEKYHIPTGIISLCIVTSIIFLSYGATLIAYTRLVPGNEALAANITMFQEFLLKVRNKIRIH